MAVPVSVYDSMEALELLVGLPFSRPTPPVLAWEGMVMANAERAVAATAAVRPTSAARRPSTGPAEATTAVRLEAALTGVLATTRVETREADMVMADIFVLFCLMNSMNEWGRFGQCLFADGWDRLL